MTLSARFVRCPRRRHVCEDCGRSITGPHIWMYGAADTYEKPWPIRLCVRCLVRTYGDGLVALRDSKLNNALTALRVHLTTTY